MVTIHIPQDEAERDISALLARVDENTTFLIENGSQPVAVLQAAPRRKLAFDERIALLQQQQLALQDDTFAYDVAAAVDRHRDPLDSSMWD